MERMNEILARAANRRISTRRALTPAQSRKSAAATPATTISAAPRRLTPGQTPAGPTGGPPPLRPMANADATDGQSAQPAADVLDADRILELPARRSAGIVRPSGTSGVYAGEMTSIRELAPTYAAQLGPRRSSRTAQPTEPAAASASAPAAQTGSRTTPAGRSTNAASKSAQGTRAARTTGKASAPGVCPRCHGAGYVRLDVPVGDPAFGQAIRCTCKEQQIEERDRSNLRRLSNLDPFRDRTFESFDSKQPGIQEAYTIARRYAKDPLGWLVFRGGFGCGKTHLAAAIA
ncbi:MAG TPA: hypothetical protein VF040_10105, partial [Ktedonobacterales bacterium]